MSSLLDTDEFEERFQNYLRNEKKLETDVTAFAAP